MPELVGDLLVRATNTLEVAPAELSDGMALVGYGLLLDPGTAHIITREAALELLVDRLNLAAHCVTQEER